MASGWLERRNAAPAVMSQGSTMPLEMTEEWREWHKGYAGDTNQTRRLSVVQDFIRQALSRSALGPIRVISMCAGDGRDLAGALQEHPRSVDVRARLVEFD